MHKKPTISSRSNLWQNNSATKGLSILTVLLRKVNAFIYSNKGPSAFQEILWLTVTLVLALIHACMYTEEGYTLVGQCQLCVQASPLFPESLFQHACSILVHTASKNVSTLIAKEIYKHIQVIVASIGEK